MNSYLVYFTALIIGFFSSNAKAQEWELNHSFIPSQTLQKIRFVNEQLGLTVGSLYNGSTENIHITRDGGKSWKDVSSGYTSMRFMDIFFFDEQVMYMSGNEGLIIRSVDGGEKWETLNTGVTNQLWALHFVDRKTGYACGSAGIIIKTIDGGISWKPLNSGVSNQLYDFEATDSGALFASGSNVLLRSDDGGDNWTKVTDFPFMAPADWIRSIKFVNSTTAYACADIGRIYKSTDGGESWARLPSITQEALFELDFVNENLGYVCGYNGTILKTQDGGMNWEILPSPIGTDHLFSIDLLSKSKGYICSHKGAIIQLKQSVASENTGRNSIQLVSNLIDQELVLSNPELMENECLNFQLVQTNGVILQVGMISKNGKIAVTHLKSGMYYLVLRNKENKTALIEAFIKI